MLSRGKLMRGFFHCLLREWHSSFAVAYISSKCVGCPFDCVHVLAIILQQSVAILVQDKISKLNKSAFRCLIEHDILDTEVTEIQLTDVRGSFFAGDECMSA